MRRTPVRLALAAAGLAAAGLALPASAGAAPQAVTFTDASGDALMGTADDIVKVTYTTTGTTATKKVGKKTVTTYTPKNLVVVVETAGDIDTSGTTQYDVEGTVPGCSFYLYVTPGSVLESPVGSCGEGETGSFDALTTTVKGKTLTFALPLKAVPGMKAGAKLSDLYAYTGSVEPITGELGPVAFGPVLPNDDAESDRVFTIA